MKSLYPSVFTISLFLLLACQNSKNLSAEALIEASVEAHGMNEFNKKAIEFQFRNYRYSQTQDKQGLVYTRRKNTTPNILDLLHSKNGFQRTLAGEKVALSDSIALIYSESLNSVLYFFRLPLSLKDPGAIKTLMDTEQISGRTYQKVGVYFTSKNGGVDHQDTFRYWFDKEIKTLDYLAYQYHTNAGGVRFRVAINRRAIEGLVFQDYENYTAPKNTPLHDLPKMYEEGKLELVSLIANDSITLIKS
ncbi:hypothetical protein N9525_04440 [Flavobacteriaceae bacterium]|nr:hypothetical protein [Flavobacteriaceae bacterium]